MQSRCAFAIRFRHSVSSFAFVIRFRHKHKNSNIAMCNVDQLGTSSIDGNDQMSLSVDLISAQIGSKLRYRPSSGSQFWHRQSNVRCLRVVLETISSTLWLHFRRCVSPSEVVNITNTEVGVSPILYALTASAYVYTTSQDEHYSCSPCKTGYYGRSYLQQNQKISTCLRCPEG